MRLAAIETATAATAVAVADGERVAHVVADERSRHTEALVPALASLLDAVGLAAGDLDAVVVDVGPGRFTGLRVGVATAKGLAVATGVGLVAVEATDVLAEAAAARRTGGSVDRAPVDVVAVVDVRRGEVAWARYRCDDHVPVRVDGPALARPDALAAALEAAPAPALGVGDGAVRYRDVLGTVLAELDDGLVVPPPEAALALATRRLAAGERAVGHAALHVRYVREADAVANFQVRGEPA